MEKIYRFIGLANIVVIVIVLLCGLMIPLGVILQIFIFIFIVDVVMFIASKLIK